MKPPKHLSREAKGMWTTIESQWDIGDAGRIVLEQGLEAFDRMREAQAIIKAEGMVTPDRFGQLKQHPAFLCERDSRNAMLKAFKQLGLANLPRTQGADEPEDFVAQMLKATRN